VAAPPDASRARAAMSFVLLMGVVSLLADACYEGARSAIGPYLGYLGASATAVGVVAGSGELVGYGLRYLTGRLADRTRAYWAITIAGYSVNLVAVPLLAVVGSWPAAAALVVLERLGKAIRNPARSTLISFAAAEIGHGKSFGIHELMDQIGAVVGPLTVAAVLWWRGPDGAEPYRWAFAILAIPAVLTLIALVTARARFPDPRALAPPDPDAEQRRLGRPFALYMVGVALVGLGLADWALLAFHLHTREVLGDVLVPVVYAAAMAADGVAALTIGHAFDRSRRHGGAGLSVLAIALAIAAASLPLVLLGSAPLALAGVAVWAIGLGATESIGKATVATLSPPSRRATAYGIYYAVFGAAWWVGSIAIGALSDWSRPAAAGFGAVSLAAAAVVMRVADRAARRITPASAPPRAG
jgi:MFS family permease